jgi:hypothetical protein
LLYNTLVLVKCLLILYYLYYELPQGHSKLINTKQNTQLLQRNSAEEYHTKALEELDLSDFNPDKLTLQEDPQTGSSTQAQI